MSVDKKNHKGNVKMESIQVRTPNAIKRLLLNHAYLTIDTQNCPSVTAVVSKSSENQDS